MKTMLPIETRRNFIKKSSMATAGLVLASSVKSYSQIVGSNDQLNVAVFGLKRRGRPIIRSLGNLSNVKVTWVCEVDSRQMEKGLGYCEEYLGYRPNAEKDLRKICEKKDVDAVFITLPDHLHAYATIIALENGKHVYVEKPASHNLAEDDLMVKAGDKHPELKIQVGTQQRSSLESQEIVSLIHGGVIGDVYKAQAFYNNARERVPVPKEVVAPDFLDWELWQGPVPRKPFLDILEDYNWHWRWHWGTAESANNGTHELDIARWALQVNYPERVMSQSGKYHFVDDGWEMYDTIEVSYRFPGNKIIQWDSKSRNAYSTYGAGRGTIIYGTEGTVFVDRGGYKLFNREGELIRKNLKEGESGIALGGGGNMTQAHVSNFLESIRGNETLNAPILQGAISTHLTHYANISSKLGDEVLEIDPTTGFFRSDSLMNQQWGRDYEPGWELSI